MSFCEITGSEYTQLLKDRLSGKIEELTWLKQFRDILHPHLKKGMHMVDIGCATGYAYNSFKEYGLSYIGVEFESEYVEIAKKAFAGSEKTSFIHHDMTEASPPVKGDVVICNATIEHCPALNPVLSNILDTSTDIVLLRTFLGEKEDIYTIPSPVKEFELSHSKYTNQYAFSDALKTMEDKGFKTRVFQDEYYKSVPQLVDHTMRTFYVVFAQRIREAL